MANLIVSFTSVGQRRTHSAPIAAGEDVRTEEILIGVGSTPGQLAAAGNEFVVELHAEAACWVAIGPAPEAANAVPTGEESIASRFIPAKGERQFSVREGSKVAVIQA